MSPLPHGQAIKDVICGWHEWCLEKFNLEVWILTPLCLFLDYLETMMGEPLKV